MAVAKKGSLLNKVEGFFAPAQSLTSLNKKKILVVGPEVSPYANVGGVSSVLAYLSTALVRSGHDVRVLMPKFGFIDDKEYELEMVHEGLEVPTGNQQKPVLICNIKKFQVPGGAPVYFLENQEYYELRANVYGYADDPIRWALLSRGAIEFVRCCSDWVPDIIHANDWQSGLLPNYMRTVYKDDEVLDKIATVFTIHNLSYQGMFDHHNVSELDMDDGRSDVANFFDERLLKQNFMRRGIMHADVINTVSPTYAREIMKPEHGEKLDKLLTEVRSKLSGILNGIDVDEFNPATDRLIEKNFDIYSIEKRVHNKLALQKEFDLEINENIPIFGYVGRMEGYKGLDLISEVLPPLMRDFNCQFVAIGGGDGHITARLRDLQKQYPGKIGAHLMLDFSLPRLLFAGADVIMVPSRFEPCGLPQMEGVRYGAIPLVHDTGGLSDSVEEYKPEVDEGYGFKFTNYDTYALFGQMVRALEAYRNKNTWKTLQRRAMMQDNSWDARAVDYNKLYEKAHQIRRKSLAEEGKIGAGLKPIM